MCQAHIMIIINIAGVMRAYKLKYAIQHIVHHVISDWVCCVICVCNSHGNYREQKKQFVINRTIDSSYCAINAYFSLNIYRLDSPLLPIASVFRVTTN